MTHSMLALASLYAGAAASAFLAGRPDLLALCTVGAIGSAVVWGRA